MVDNHIDIPYAISITQSHIKIPIDISMMSDLPYRYSISISHIDIGSYLVTLAAGGHAPPALPLAGTALHSFPFHLHCQPAQLWFCPCNSWQISKHDTLKLLAGEPPR
jgi:hypothetical protein